MSSPGKKHRVLNAFFMLFVILVTLWLVLSSVYLVLRTLASKEQKLPSVFGYQISAETTGRMDEAIPKGSAVLAIERPNLISGDIILYRHPDEELPVCGRIKTILSFDDDPEYAVSFDNEPAAAANVYRSAVWGQVVYAIPYLGYLVDYLGTFHGILFTVLIPGVVLILLLTLRMVFSVRAGKRGEESLADEEEYVVTPALIERRADSELVYRNEELDAIWQQKKAGSGETDEIITDQDMVYQLSNLNNTFANPEAAREQERARREEAEKIVSEFSRDVPKQAAPASEEPKSHDPVVTVPPKPSEEKAADYERLISDLDLDKKESNDLISMLRQYGITDQESVKSVQKAAPFIRPVVTDHSVDLDLESQPAQRVRVVSDEYGKFLIVESDHVETKVKLPF